ncbi:fimbrial protein [Pantoea sp. B623]|uniref:fimbrial protein n=1 Tax=Pantoea sp. B623 TaxID=2974561 RepID=UPI00216AAF89|nr:fimbrial protein [Pantoea sp. B623]MCS4492670.1 fimbrial protein [Pantoea sp. B623]
MKKHATIFPLLMATFFTSSALARCESVPHGSPGGDAQGGVPLSYGTIKLTPEEFMPVGLIGVTNVSVGQAQAFQTRQGPDTLLYICDAADQGKTFENFATNGDESTGGYNGNSEGVYQTFFPFIGIKLIRDKDGKVFSRYWQQSPISGHRAGNKLYFYASDFSSVTAEIYRLPATMRGKSSADWSKCGGPAADDSRGITYTCTQPNGYTVFVGPGWNDARDIKPGSDSNTHWGGFSASNWIGFGMHYAADNSFTQTQWGCRVFNYTNPVTLPPVTLSELKAGVERGANFNVTYRCGGTAIAQLIDRFAGVGPNKISVAFSTNHPVPGNGVMWSRYTLSDNDGQDGYASNVGIGISVAGKEVGFLTNVNTDQGVGWFSPLDGVVSRSNNGNNQVDITSQYFAFYGIIDPSKPVIPGQVDATAYINVRYW